MEILFIPNDVSSEDLLNMEINDIISQDLFSIRSILNKISPSYTIQTIDISKSADFILYRVSLDLVISSNMDYIYKYINWGDLIMELKNYTSMIYFDKSMLYCLALSFLYKKYNSKDIVLQSEKSISLDDLSPFFQDRNSTDFISNPFLFYSMLFQLDSIRKEFVLMRSDGVVEYNSSFSNMNFYF